MKSHVPALIYSALSDVHIDKDMIDVHTSRTELDTRANMVTLGKYARVISLSGETVQVNPFISKSTLFPEVPTIDVVIAYA